ncbi:MAG: hypothetical protein KAI43_09190 [Candidatus Aureabacteria bacterium]|nr:hypothetical protein [Candidatus Auribacterota bacterium]
MRNIQILPSFERSTKRLSKQDKEKLKISLKQFSIFLSTGVLPKGLGLKKINRNKYEIRIDIRLRLVMKLEKDILYLILVGNHNDIKRYLREHR